jgi:ADP-ribose pyrophosphatase YjhB (NUDIX family)
MVEANEPPNAAAQRELAEELGLSITPGRVLCVDWVAPHGPWDDLLSFIFDGGQLATAEAAQLSLRDGELTAAEFCSIDQARQRLRPYVFTRLQAALAAAETGAAQYLVNGCAPV